MTDLHNRLTEARTYVQIIRDNHRVLPEHRIETVLEWLDKLLLKIASEVEGV